VQGCAANNIPEQQGKAIFDLVEVFAGYGFNKAHTAAYGMIAYQTAYLKANYPIEYLCGLLQNEENQDRVAAIVVDCQDHDIQVTPPDVNTSESAFAVVGDAIAFGMKGVKNVGIRAIELIVEERQKNGPYESLLDLCLRLDLHEVNKRVLESLIKCGAMDSLGERQQLLMSLDRFVDRAQAIQLDRASGQVSLFGDGPMGDEAEVRLTDGVVPADDRTRLAWEREFLGIYLSDHPLRRVEAELHTRTDTRCIEIVPELEGFEVRIGGVVREVRKRPDRSGRMMAWVELEDLTGSVVVTVFSRTLEQAADIIQPDRIVIMRAKVDTRRRGRDAGEGESAGLVADQVWAFDEADLDQWQRAQVVQLAVADGLPRTVIEDLNAVLAQFPGVDTVTLRVDEGSLVTELELPVRVEPGEELRQAVETILGPGSYHCEVVRRKVLERKTFTPRQPQQPEPEWVEVG
jgi:DNA polymerase-3 subunit alpha